MKTGGKKIGEYSKFLPDLKVDRRSANLSTSREKYILKKIPRERIGL